jgi:hypothetical protein
MYRTLRCRGERGHLEGEWKSNDAGVQQRSRDFIGVTVRDNDVGDMGERTRRIINPRGNKGRTYASGNKRGGYNKPAHHLCQPPWKLTCATTHEEDAVYVIASACEACQAHARDLGCDPDLLRTGS